MKNTLLTFFCIAIASLVFGQTHTAKFSNSSGEKKVTIITSSGELNISTHNSSEILISTNDYEAPPERARGLKPLYNNAVDNTGIGLEIKESGNEMTIKKASNEEMDFDIKIPKNAKLHIKEIGWNGDGITVKDVAGEIEIAAQGSDILIKNASGPVVASTVNGDVEIIFTSVNPDRPNSISCTNGFIDVTIPSDTKADLRMKSINGEVYTDMDIDMDKGKDGLKLIGSYNISGSINGGGVEIDLRAINDDIYLRKGN